jgi:hypothetical protein
MEGGISDLGLRMSALGDAAKAISRKLREQDAIFTLRPGHFGVILPGMDTKGTKGISARIADGLHDAAGASERFSFRIETISYPEQTSSAHDLELAVGGWLPEDDTKQTVVPDAHLYA